MAKKLPSFDSDPPAPTPASEEADRRLTGQILAAMPMLDDPRFAHSVILVCAHNADGAMGIILNRSLDRPNFEGLLKQLDISPVPPQRQIRLCAGGPIDSVRGFVLHTRDWTAENSLAVDEDFALTTSLDILKAVAEGNGPRECLLALGYAGWGPGQLDEEFGNNAWLSVPSDEALIFDSDNSSRWRRALDKLHVDPALLSPTAGHG
jgi:putative transcriptional regulator